MTGYDRPPNAESQAGRILKLLIDANGEWIPLLEIFKVAKQYSARIFELRAAGFAIENRIEAVDGVRHSWFRLPVAPPKPIDPAPLVAMLETMPLFGKEVR